MPGLSLQLDTPELADQYEKVSADRQFNTGKTLADDLNIASAEQVLDVGCGTGALARYLADRVGGNGRVVGIDPLPLRIDIARRNTMSNLRFEVADACDLSMFSEASFDVVYLNEVFHWLTEPQVALLQFKRVLRPGGRLGISTGSNDHPNPIQEINERVLSREPYTRYADAASGVPPRLSVATLRDLLAEAGFRVIALTTRTVISAHATPDAAVEYLRASSFGNFLSQVPPTLQDRVRAELHEELQQLMTADGIRQESTRIFAVAIPL